MHIARIHLRSFKRFHDLTIEISGTPDLVVMAGPNGLGKSSVIDALRSWHGGHGSGDGWGLDEAYHKKAGDAQLIPDEMVEVSFAEPLEGVDPRKLIYARSAYRHEPDFTAASVQRQGDVFSAPRAQRMIDSEQKVSNNYQRLVSTAIDEVFGGNHATETVGDLVDRHIGRVREALQYLFPDLELQGPGDPIGGGTFYFRKNGRAQFHYKNLSGGEKAVFDLVLDLVIKTAAYDDTVIIIDEPDLHLNSRLQAGLLDLLLSLKRPSDQLWVATHSIGMMRKAVDRWSASHDTVAFLDFENRDFDAVVTMHPQPPTREFWSRVLATALDDMAGLVAPDQVVLCEGRPGAQINVARAEFDARCYRRIFAREYPRTDFISVGNSDQVHSDRLELGRTIQTIVSGTRVIRVVDRDMRTDEEIETLRAGGTRVLSRRHLETYLLADDVIDSLCVSAGRPEMVQAAKDALTGAMTASVGRGNAPDDVKSAAGEFYMAARKLLALRNAGSTHEAFLTDTMAPLLQEGMPSYEALKQDIFGQ